MRIIVIIGPFNSVWHLFYDIYEIAVVSEKNHDEQFNNNQVTNGDFGVEYLKWAPYCE